MRTELTVADRAANLEHASPKRRRPPVVLAAVTFLLLLAATVPVGAGWLRGALALGLLVLAPTAASLTRRMVQNLALAIPLLVLTAWLPLGDAQVPTLLAAASALVVAEGRRAGWRHLLPTTNGPEVSALVLVAGAAWFVSLPFASAGDSTNGLALLLRGWDHASHFDMYLAHRTGLEVGSSGDSPWYFAHYPQLFHALLARTAELVWGPVTSVPAELLRYTALQSVVFTAVVLLAVAATLDAIPRSDRRRRAWAAASCCVLLLAFPGSSLLLFGHLNFLLSSVAAAALVVLARERTGPLTPPYVLTMASLVVVVASWPLLVPCVALLALGVLRAGLRSPSTRYWAAASGVAAAAASVYLVGVSIGSDPVAHLTAAGGLAYPSLASTVLVLTALVVVTRPRRAASGRRHPSDLFTATASSVALLLAIAGVQLLQTGELSYYFWKAAIGVELVLLLAASPHAATPWRTSVRVLGPRLGPVLTKALLVGLFGLAALVSLLQLPFGGLALYTFIGSPAPAEQREIGWQLLQLSADETLDPRTTTFVSTMGGQFSPALADQWYHSLTRTRTIETSRFDAALDRPWLDHSVSVSDVVAELSATGNQTLVVTEPELYRTSGQGSRAGSPGHVVLVPGR